MAGARRVHDMGGLAAGPLDRDEPAHAAWERRIDAIRALCAKRRLLRTDEIRRNTEDLGPGVYRIKSLVEKPRREEAPSNLAIIGRYILTPDIFAALEATKSDRTGEIQLTNGLRELQSTRPLYACEIVGVRHDTGNKLGFLKALVYFALKRPELAEPFRRYLETLDLKVPAGR